MLKQIGFDYVFDTYFGADSISEIVTEAKKRGFSKALVVTDPDLIKFNVAQKVTALI